MTTLLALDASKALPLRPAPVIPVTRESRTRLEYWVGSGEFRILWWQTRGTEAPFAWFATGRAPK